MDTLRGRALGTEHIGIHVIVTMHTRRVLTPRLGAA